MVLTRRRCRACRAQAEGLLNDAFKEIWFTQDKSTEIPDHLFGGAAPADPAGAGARATQCHARSGSDFVAPPRLAVLALYRVMTGVVAFHALLSVIMIGVVRRQSPASAPAPTPFVVETRAGAAARSLSQPTLAEVAKFVGQALRASERPVAFEDIHLARPHRRHVLCPQQRVPWPGAVAHRRSQRGSTMGERRAKV